LLNLVANEIELIKPLLCMLICLAF